jgi:hypothetical protein
MRRLLGRLTVALLRRIVALLVLRRTTGRGTVGLLRVGGLLRISLRRMTLLRRVSAVWRLCCQSVYMIY